MVYNTIDNGPLPICAVVISSIVALLAVIFCVGMYIGKGRTSVITLRGGTKGNPYLLALIPIVMFYYFFLNVKMLEINVYNHDKTIYYSKDLKTVEGNVTDYYPEPDAGHADEEFKVQGIFFHYSHFEEGRSGYHDTRFYGGVIKPNLYVKIGYYYDGDRNAILKLETE